ncbi:hypothetical protein GCM10022631_09450 [Deinococcus rubellus]|uniref:hypothetical protein n=1 Tax=Deinococcus rubellus TaxID=1889240 RepID=UPI0031E9640D
MVLNPERRIVPESLTTPSFTLRRQRLEDNEADFQAVMDSRGELRVWSDSPWPEDDFSLAANLADLHTHIAEHDQHEAYGFSVFTPDGSALLGSLYINEVAPFLENYTVSIHQRAVLDEGQARVEYWLRRGTTPEFEQRFLTAVRRWLAEHWWFAQSYFGSRRAGQAQRQFYEAAGLRELVCLTSRDGTRQFFFHG